MVASPVQVGSPEWWLYRLYAQLDARRPNVDLFTAYYDGDHPLPWLAPQARDEFRRILRMTRANYCGLVIDAMTERANIEGFRLALGDDPADPDGDPDIDALDADTWRIWQANKLDAGFPQVLQVSGITGVGLLQVEPNPKDPSTPFVWTEHPSQAIVDYLPGTNRQVRAASLKVWIDDWTDTMCATVQSPSNVYKYQAKLNSSGTPEWSRRDVAGEQWAGRNLAGEVTMVEIPNNPQMLTGGRSELFDVIDTQDRINKTIADRLITQDFGAFPQKWAKGWPTEDDAGNPAPSIDIGRNRIVSTDATEAAFGQWEAASLDPYSAAKREDVKDIASRTRTPAQYLLGDMSNVDSQSLQASQSGLIAKLGQRFAGWGEGAETAMGIARRLAGLPDVGVSGMESIWRNPEFRTLGELTDAVVKQVQTGIIDLRLAREKIGYSATQIRRLESREALARDQQNRAVFGMMQDAPHPGAMPPSGDNPGAPGATLPVAG